jgi:hypothetical protein
LPTAPDDPIGKDSGFVLTVHGDDQVNIAGHARQTRCDDREPAYDHIVRLALVQFAAKGHEISLDGRARL